MTDQEPDKKRIVEGIEIVVDEAKAGVRKAIRSSGVESLGENLKETLQGALSARNSVVMVRLNEESLARLDDLVEAGVVNSRSESAAYLIGEGINARRDLFDRISNKIDQIRKAKKELKQLLDETPGDKNEATDDEPSDKPE